jgi:hypothetical protein
MRTSAESPGGHPNDWPLDDKNAFAALVLATGRRLAEGAGDIEAVHAASTEIGLEGGPDHWMVDEVLGGMFGAFYVRSGDHYISADGLLRFGTDDDLERLGRDAVVWALTLSANSSEH